MSTKPPIFQNSNLDGTSFFWESNKGAKTAILLFHGFTATTVEVKTFAEFFFKKGFSVSGPLLPGHGVSPEELNMITYEEWVQTAKEAFIVLKSKFENVFVVGESMGGLIALWLSYVFPDQIKGIILCSPALRIPGLWKSTILWPFVNQIYKNNIDLSSPWQGFNVIPLRAASQLYQFQKIINKILPKIKTPMLVFQGKLDTTVDQNGSVNIIRNVSSKKRELVWLEESSHCILLDKQLSLVEKSSLEFINNLSERATN
ncbi:MAG: alpha/beta fold hydrolase [Chloroflexi bacterium]|nr:alpha/beta fold hydrolase [Chloroflexota bacterium]